MNRQKDTVQNVILSIYKKEPSTLMQAVQLYIARTLHPYMGRVLIRERRVCFEMDELAHVKRLLIQL